jgi:hypothetical protein
METNLIQSLIVSISPLLIGLLTTKIVQLFKWVMSIPTNSGLKKTLRTVSVITAGLLVLLNSYLNGTLDSPENVNIVITALDTLVAAFIAHLGYKSFIRSSKASR